jgi:hypothetical protein
MLANINVNRLDDSWLGFLDLDEHEFELVDATMFMPHGWILGARLSDHTEGVLSSVVFDADSEFVKLIRTRSVLLLKTHVMHKRGVSRAGHSSCQDQYFSMLTLPDIGSHIC